MWLRGVLVLLCLAACSKWRASPCLSDVDCASFGRSIVCQRDSADAVRGVCRAGCTASDQCLEASLPVCTDGHCAACTTPGATAQDAACESKFASLPFCGAAGTCVECVDDNACAASMTRPHCGGETCVECTTDAQCAARGLVHCDVNVCTSCIAHSECATGICTGGGTCAAAAQVAYVDNKNGTCTGAHSGNTAQDAHCELLDAIANDTRTYFVVAGSATQYKSVTIKPTTAKANWVIAGPGRSATTRADIGTTGTGIYFDSTMNSSASRLDLYGIGIAGSGYGLYAQAMVNSVTVDAEDIDVHPVSGQGVSAFNATLTLRKSLIRDTTSVALQSLYSGKIEFTDGEITNCNGIATAAFTAITLARSNLHANKSGIDADAANITIDRCMFVGTLAAPFDCDGCVYSITNTHFEGNLTPFGNIPFAFHRGATGRFSFNTVRKNNSTFPDATINCDTTAPMLIDNSLFFGNQHNSINSQFFGACTLANNVTDADTRTDGNTLTIGNADFVDPNTGPALKPSSASNRACCVDKGAPTSTVPAIDIVGTTRPQNSTWDIGAYEVRTAP